MDATRMARVSKAGAPITKVFFERAAKGELRWCLTAYPSHAMAQEADMGLNDYREFVYRVGLRQEKQAGNLIMPNSAQHSIIRMV